MRNESSMVGGLDEGKDADLVVWSDLPFAAAARAEMVFINGKDVTK